MTNKDPSVGRVLVNDLENADVDSTGLSSGEFNLTNIKTAIDEALKDVEPFHWSDGTPQRKGERTLSDGTRISIAIREEKEGSVYFFSVLYPAVDQRHDGETYDLQKRLHAITHYDDNPYALPPVHETPETLGVNEEQKMLEWLAKYNATASNNEDLPIDDKKEEQL